MQRKSVLRKETKFEKNKNGSVENDFITEKHVA